LLEAQAAGNSRALASAAFALCVCTGDSAPARAAGFFFRKKERKKLSLLVCALAIARRRAQQVF
jgi:hypothetical protein